MAKGVVKGILKSLGKKKANKPIKVLPPGKPVRTVGANAPLKYTRNKKYAKDLDLKNLGPVNINTNGAPAPIEFKSHNYSTKNGGASRGKNPINKKILDSPTVDVIEEASKNMGELKKMNFPSPVNSSRGNNPLRIMADAQAGTTSGKKIDISDLSKKASEMTDSKGIFNSLKDKYSNLTDKEKLMLGVGAGAGMLGMAISDNDN